MQKKSTDPACVCLHKGESCTCLSSIVEPLLILLKEDNDCIIKHRAQSSRPFPCQSQHDTSSLAILEKKIIFTVPLCPAYLNQQLQSALQKET